MLKHRAISGIILGAALLLAAHLLPRVGVWVVIVAIQCFAQLEFYALLKQAEIPSFKLVGMFCGVALVSATFWTIGRTDAELARSYQWEHAVLAATLLVIFVRQFPQKHNPKPLETIACTLLGIWYVPYLFNFLTRLVFAWADGSEVAVTRTGRLIVLYLIVVVKCSDMGAYFTGRLLGRHKLFPRLSPKKTWEGLAGGIVWALIASCCFSYFNGGNLGNINLGMMHAVILGVILTVVGLAGDLFESLLKRAASMKDSSGTLPGLGGILDVLDSLLFGAPVLYFYARAFLSAG